HLSCRAYDDIATEQNEREVHAAHLMTAAPLIEQWLDGVTAEAYLVEMADGSLVVSSVPLP
ncbi:MAG: hypothetical protein AAB349_01505, partial [Chloroflexota bacterium]